MKNSIKRKFTQILKGVCTGLLYLYPQAKVGIYWIQVRRAATATVEISLCTR